MDNKELFKSMLLSSADFIVADFSSKINIRKFNNVISNLCDKTYFDDMHDLKMFLEEKVYILEHQGKWWSLNKPNAGEAKAYQLALDICSSIIKRFIDGGEGEGKGIAS